MTKKLVASDQEKSKKEFLSCDTCSGPLEVILTTPKELGIMCYPIGDNEPIHQGMCHECKLTVPLDY